MISLPLQPCPELQRIFDDRTAAIYRFMVARVEERNSKAGAFARAGHFIPFTQSEFASWVVETLGGDVQRIVQCAYCNRWLSVATFVVDHRIPMGWPWLGSLGLDNLALSCASCNQRKGCMSDDGFMRLVQWATASLDRRDMSDMLSRMATAGMARRRGTEYSSRKKTQDMREMKLMR